MQSHSISFLLNATILNPNTCNSHVLNRNLFGENIIIDVDDEYELTGFYEKGKKTIFETKIVQTLESLDIASWTWLFMVL